MSEAKKDKKEKTYKCAALKNITDFDGNRVLAGEELELTQEQFEHFKKSKGAEKL
tara:strand:+ start:1837 stop:2001 length:165 start_codon:yes stop_codon:yes gene_type:complete